MKPRCKHFGVCGGCSTQNLSYDQQLQKKLDHVRDELKNGAGIAPKMIKPVIGMAEPWFYRNKASLPVQRRNGKVVLGYFEPESHRVCDMEECFIQHKAITMMALELKKLMQEYDISIYDENAENQAAGKAGLVRHVIIRRGNTSKQMLLGFVSRETKIPNINKVIRKLGMKFPNLVGVVLNHNTVVGNVIMGEENLTLWGYPQLTDQMGKLKFAVGLSSFYQTNSAQAEKAYDKVKDFARLTGKEKVWDIYCGIGTISLWIASSARYVVGIEEVQEAVQNAAWNADSNQIPNVKFAAGRAEEVIDELMEDKKRLPQVVIVNPPRAGLSSSVLHKILEIGPDRLIYVSCNPATLARDLRQMTQGRYQVMSVQPYDFFPQTSHVENVVLIKK